MYMDFEIFFGFNEAWNENIAVALFRTHQWHTVAASCQTFIYVHKHKFDKTFLCMVGGNTKLGIGYLC